MRSRFEARLTRLEAQSQVYDAGSHGQGLSTLPKECRRYVTAEDRVPLEALTDAALDGKITALSGPRGFSLVWRELREAERVNFVSPLRLFRVKVYDT